MRLVFVQVRLKEIWISCTQKPFLWFSWQRGFEEISEDLVIDIEGLLMFILHVEFQVYLSFWCQQTWQWLIYRNICSQFFFILKSRKLIPKIEWRKGYFFSMHELFKICTARMSFYCLLVFMFTKHDKKGFAIPMGF